jgi:hypothetical protein
MQAICAGRTLVPQDNLYLHQIIPMAASSDLVRHAMLALAASYVLDFEHRSELRSRAEKHHKSAVQLFGEQIRQRVNYDPGQEFILVAGTILYMHQQVSVSHDRWTIQLLMLGRLSIGKSIGSVKHPQDGTGRSNLVKRFLTPPIQDSIITTQNMCKLFKFESSLVCVFVLVQ